MCVDLDGTLFRTDSLHECFLSAIKSRPDILFRIPFWLASGRYHFKRMVTRYAADSQPFTSMPVRPEVRDLILAARRNGKQVELVSAADQELISSHAGFTEMFDAVIGSSEGVNLRGHAKAELLLARHQNGFAYVGNSAADLPIWRLAAERFGVNLSPSVRRQAESEGLEITELANDRRLPFALLRSLRPHQWLKNLLLFVPLALIISSAGLEDVAKFVIGFVAFCLMTSGTYLINDLFDLQADRAHPRKCNRPIASGALPASTAGLASTGLILLALAGALSLGWPFAATIVTYLILTLAYSLRLKQLALVDVFVVAALFTLRIIAGMLIIAQAPSHWLLTFSAFFFLSLALMKREVELNATSATGVHEAQGRGYRAEDRTFVVPLGLATGVASLVVFALFISAITEQQPANYRSPVLFWGVLALIGYWLSRMWLLTARGEMDDDPVLYASRDVTSLILGAAVLTLAAAAQVVSVP